MYYLSESQFSILPIPHSEELVIPKPPTNFHFDSDTEFLQEDTMPLDADEDYVDKHTKIPHLILQSELNDLVRDLSLTKNQAEILGSRLQEWLYYQMKQEYLFSEHDKKIFLVISKCKIHYVIVVTLIH